MKYYFFTIHKTPKRSTVSDDYALGVLARHTAYFKELGTSGKCIVAGPFVDQKTDLGGGCYIFAAEDETEARLMASDDPLVVEGLYDFKMYEWNRVV